MNSKKRNLLIVMLGLFSITGFAQTGREGNAEYQGGYDRLNISYEGSTTLGHAYMQSLYYNSPQTGIGFYKTSSNSLLMSLLDNGNVGIGSLAPAEKLEVNGNVSLGRDYKLMFGTAAVGGNGEYISNLYSAVSGSWGLAFFTGSNIRAAFTLTGNFGINTTTAAEKLEVNGNIKGSGTGNIYTTGSTGDIYTSGTSGNIYTTGGVANIYTVGGRMGVGVVPSGTSERFEVVGGIKTSGTGGNIYTTGSDGRIYSTAASAHIFTQGATANIYTTTGKMGVGVVPTGSTEKLEVAGNVKTSGSIFTTGTSASIFTAGTAASIFTNSADGHIYTSSASGHIFTVAGKIGVGVTPNSSSEALEVVGNVKSTGLIVNGVSRILTNPANASKAISTTQTNGKKYSLFVDYGVVSEDFVLAEVASWADFVFEDGYKLPSLSEVEKFVAKNKHLPAVPSEAEVKKDGYGVHDMNKVFLQKIEELTLYMIDQDKKIIDLQNTIKEMSEKMNKEK